MYAVDNSMIIIIFNNNECLNEANIKLIIWVISGRYTKGTSCAACLIGWWSPVSIICSTPLVSHRSMSSSANMSFDFSTQSRTFWSNFCLLSFNKTANFSCLSVSLVGSCPSSFDTQTVCVNISGSFSGCSARPIAMLLARKLLCFWNWIEIIK